MNGDAQRRAEALLDERAPGAEPGLESLERDAPRTGFSPFLPGDAERAREASRELILASQGAGGGDAGLAAAMARADELLSDHDSGLVRFALKLFMTHDPDGRRLHIPALETRSPLKVLPSPATFLEATGVAEAVLNWWREDPEANEHHDHWHAVYPTTGIADPRPGDPDHTRLQDRQGELFFYMHQQMLARYDHERLAVGLPRVEPLDDYDSAIDEGYDATAGLQGFGDDWTDGELPTPRPDGARMPGALQLQEPPAPPLRRSTLAAWRQALRDAASQGRLINAAGQSFAATVDDLGHATEPSSPRGATVDPSSIADRGRYGALHGLGHIFLAYAAGGPGGVMADTDTAIRDPVFFRWHRHIDDFAFEWQERQSPHDLTEGAGAVRLRRGAAADASRPAESGDLIVVPETPQLSGLDDDAYAGTVAQAVGDAHWNDDFATRAPGTDEIQTEMLTRRLEVDPPLAGPPVDIPYLDHRPFGYAVRLTNTAGEDHDVTVRLFLVADELFDQRRMWVELDKFRFRATGEQAVAVRRAASSSVIRKPASKPPGPTRHSPAPAGDYDEESFCECGWPYNLLIPRGTADGMSCWLAAVVTDWTLDDVGHSACGSMSFCGAKDRYPDKRPMGYPFDRPITGAQITAALNELPHMAARRVRIRWLNPQFPA